MLLAEMKSVFYDMAMLQTNANIVIDLFDAGQRPVASDAMYESLIKYDSILENSQTVQKLAESYCTFLEKQNITISETLYTYMMFIVIQKRQFMADYDQVFIMLQTYTSSKFIPTLSIEESKAIEYAKQLDFEHSYIILKIDNIQSLAKILMLKVDDPAINPENGPVNTSLHSEVNNMTKRMSIVSSHRDAFIVKYKKHIENSQNKKFTPEIQLRLFRHEKLVKLTQKYIPLFLDLHFRLSFLILSYRRG